MPYWQKWPFTVQSTVFWALRCRPGLLCQGSTTSCRMAALLKSSFLETCNMLENCSSVTSHLVHWLGKEELVCWEEVEVTELPQIQHLVFAGPGLWQSHSRFQGVIHLTELYGDEPDRFGCDRNNPFRGAGAPWASKTEDTLFVRQSTTLTLHGVFCRAQAVSQPGLPCWLPTQHVDIQPAAFLSLWL